MEMVLAIAILAIISLVVFLSVNSEDKIGKAGDAKRVEDLARLNKAIELYQLDNDQLPEFFSLADLAEGEKRVLCSSEATLTCDDQNHTCVVVSGDFLTNYLSSLPVDPVKDSALDSGYYISRQGGNQLLFGACQNYSGQDLKLTARAALPDYVASISCGDASCNGEENCQTCPEDCGACPVYDYQIAAGSDDWHVHSTQGTIDDATTLSATYNAIFNPAVTSFAYGDISTGSLPDAADILEAEIYFYIDSYSTAAPPKSTQPTKEFYIKIYNGVWSTIHTGTFLAAGWYSYELTSGQLDYINKTGDTNILIGVNDPGVGYNRDMAIRAYEYAGDYSMYLDITVVE